MKVTADCWACGTKLDFGQADSILDFVGKVVTCPICGAECMLIGEIRIVPVTENPEKNDDAGIQTTDEIY